MNNKKTADPIGKTALEVVSYLWSLCPVHTAIDASPSHSAAVHLGINQRNVSWITHNYNNLSRSTSSRNFSINTRARLLILVLSCLETIANR
jgi:hypothetical protein